MLKLLLAQPLRRNIVAILHDTLMAAVSFMLAVSLRLGKVDIFERIPYLSMGCVCFTLLCLGVFLAMRHYQGMWRYASLQDLIAITKSVSIAIGLFIVMLFFFTRLEGYPRSALMINWLLLIAMLGAPRLLYRLVRDRGLYLDWQQLTDHRVPVLVIGANNLAEVFLRNTMQNPDLPYRVVALVDDDYRIHSRVLHGVKIMGGTDSLEKIFTKLTQKDQRPHKIILADDELDGAQVRSLLERAEKLGVSMARVPSLATLHSSNEKPSLTPIAIEDLLGRPQHTLDLEAIRHFIAGRRVLITGAGGTIGGEITRQVASFAPSQLLLLDQSEIGLYTTDKALEVAFPDVPRMALLADVRDRHHMRFLCQHHRPDLVFHAAAVKHVPLAETNPHEAILTNIIGTRNVVDAACDAGVTAMVMISTDKAVHPTSFMGATKRAAEYYCQVAGAAAPATRVMTVRFGNVLGSTGSVVPLFRQQLERGGPLTVTHSEMTRYFMTVREAVALVLQTAAGAEEESSGQIFVLDMGDPVRILDLAEQMIRLAGLRPYEDIPIDLIGLRQGEKLYEELFYPEEAPVPTRYHAIMRARLKELNNRSVSRSIDLLEKAALQRDTPRILSLMQELVPEYQNTPTPLA